MTIKFRKKRKRDLNLYINISICGVKAELPSISAGHILQISLNSCCSRDENIKIADNEMSALNLQIKCPSCTEHIRICGNDNRSRYLVSRHLFGLEMRDY